MTTALVIAMMTMFNVCLLLVLIVWLLDREDGRPRRARVLRFRRPVPRARRAVGARSITRGSPRTAFGPRR